MAWVSATSHVDTTGLWNDEAKARDGLVSWPNVALHVNHPSGTWTGFLELHRAGTWCDYIRFWRGTWIVGKINTADIDVYHSGQWWNVYQGPFSVDTGGYWVQWALGGTYLVTAIRCRCHNGDGEGRASYVWEGQFNTTAEPIPPYVPYTNLIDPKWNWNNSY